MTRSYGFDGSEAVLTDQYMLGSKTTAAGILDIVGEAAAWRFLAITIEPGRETTPTAG
ncbi:MAG: hypothetical protein ACSLE4_06295 [Methyloceanibacter sp.]|uniref:hypothetical protein n=1 Tax=Methyloceanibacter sp. TaxID=1965321 RepID=UPI003EE088BC